MNNNSHNNSLEYPIDAKNLPAGLSVGKLGGHEKSVSSVSSISVGSSTDIHLPKYEDHHHYAIPIMTPTETRKQNMMRTNLQGDDVTNNNDDVTSSTPQTTGERMKDHMTSMCKCCSQTYYATICVVLIMIGCPLAAVGSQEDINWAMYSGIVLVLTAFLLSLVAPNIRGFFRNLIPRRIRNHAAFKRMIKSKVGAKNLPT